jgi:hypothetical protein
LPDSIECSDLTASKRSCQRAAFDRAVDRYRVDIVPRKNLP